MGANLNRRVPAILIAGLGLSFGCTGNTGNTSPTLSRLDPVQIKVGERKTIAATATDEDGDSISFRFVLELFPGDAERQENYSDPVRLPRGLTWRPGTPTSAMEWAPSANQVGTNHRLTFIASDGADTVQELALVTVLPGDSAGTPTDGRPVISSHRNLILDPNTSKCLSANIRVDAPAAQTIRISLQGAPAGMEVKAVDEAGKQATLSWCPTDEQLAAKSVYSFIVLADDGEHEPANEKFTVLIRKGERPGTGDVEPDPECPGDAPTVTHEEIGDQRGEGRYPIEASMTDTDTRVQRGVMGYTWHDPNAADALCDECWEPMEATTGDRWLGSIPNLADLPQDPDIDRSRPLRLHYFICALDDDDPGESTVCDKFGCAPDEEAGWFSFTAYPAGEGGGEQCLNDDDEPNEDAGNAADLGNDERSGLVLCQGDTDWWSVRGGEGQDITFALRFSRDRGNLGLVVLDPAGVEVGRSDGESDEESVQVVGASAGSYALGVTGLGVGAAGTSYRIAVSRIGEGDGGDCPRDAGEPNDSSEAATRVAPGVLAPLNLCGEADDADWYSVVLSNGDALTAGIRFSDAEGDLDLQLYAPDNVERSIKRSLSVSDDEELNHTAEVGGTYFVRVFSFRDPVTEYSLEISIVEDGDGGEDGCASDTGREPNDDRVSAAPIEGPVPCGRIDDDGLDQDWYRVDLAAYEGFRIDLRFPHGDGDLDLDLFADDGVTKIDSSASVNDDETITFPGTSAGGTWYLKVYGFRGNSNEYSVEFGKIVFQGGDGCLLDRFEPNNEPANLSPYLGRRAQIKEYKALSSCGDADWYQVIVPEGFNLDLDMDYEPDHGNLDLHLLDRAGVEEIGERVVDEDEGFEYIVTNNPGTWYIRVTGVGQAKNLYELTVGLGE